MSFGSSSQALDVIIITATEDDIADSLEKSNTVLRSLQVCLRLLILLILIFCIKGDIICILFCFF